MWDSSHTHKHHTINQIGASQSPSLKSLTFSLGLTLWGSVSKPTRDYWVGSDTICNNPKKSASYICAIPQKDQSQLRFLVVVNKSPDLPSKYPMWDSSHTHTYHIINQIGASQYIYIYIYIYEIGSSYTWCNSIRVTHFLNH